MSRSLRAIVSNRLPANDAHLVQLVRGRLGREDLSLPERINVSSCKFDVTLHGAVPSFGIRNCVENAAEEVSGVREVINKLRVREDCGTSGFPPADFGVSDLVEYPKVPE